MSEQNLKNLVERIERLNEEKANIMADTKEVYDEAGAFGYDKKVLRKVIAIRAMDPNTRDEQEALTELYLNQVGV